MMYSFNVNFGNNHLLLEIEELKRPERQAATQVRTLQMQKKVKNKSNLSCTVIMQNAFTQDLMSMVMARMRKLYSIKNYQMHKSHK